MTKRIVLLSAVALMAVLSAAPDAMANHCFRCKFVAGEQEFDCVPVFGSTPGRPICVTDGITCQTSGNQCTLHTASTAPLASEYTVATVERLDDPGSDAGETRVAPIQVAQSMTR
ncbi:MAG TPA: hypothetical protein VF432_09215 [Thermoanaerobaculia bacterium]